MGTVLLWVLFIVVTPYSIYELWFPSKMSSGLFPALDLIILIKIYMRLRRG